MVGDLTDPVEEGNAEKFFFNCKGPRKNSGPTDPVRGRTPHPSPAHRYPQCVGLREEWNSLEFCDPYLYQSRGVVHRV